MSDSAREQRGWRILAAELRIPWGSRVGAHRMLVIADPSGAAVRQINGLASWYDERAGVWRHKPVGYLPTDRLRGYDTLTHPRTWLPIHGVTYGAQPDAWNVEAAIRRGDVCVLAGEARDLDAAELRVRLEPALSVLKAVNALSDGPEGGAGLPYPFLGFGRNSNSFFATAIRALGVSQPRFARPAWLAPGAGDVLLSPEVLSRLGAVADAPPSPHSGS
ncbi:MAG: hypothetical protein R3C52_08390 [Hyphomonadaceae bacterium]